MINYQGSGFQEVPYFFSGGGIPPITIDFNCSLLYPDAGGWNGRYFVDATTGNIVATINDVTGSTAQGTLRIQKLDSTANTVSFQPSGTQTLNGTTDPYILSGEGEFVEIDQDGTNNFIVTNSTKLLAMAENAMQLVNPVIAGDLATFDSSGQVEDSGISITTNPTANDDVTVPTTHALMLAIAAAQISNISFQDGYDASTNTYPALDSNGDPIKKGDYWIIEVAGNLGGTNVFPGDAIIARFPTPGQTPSNWLIVPNGLKSFKGRTAPNVVPTADDYSYDMVTGAAPLASPAFTGTPTAPNVVAGDSSTKLANTAYVDAGLVLKEDKANKKDVVNNNKTEFPNSRAIVYNEANQYTSPIHTPVQFIIDSTTPAYAGLFTQGGDTAVPGDRLVVINDPTASNNVIYVIYDDFANTWMPAEDTNNAIRLQNTFIAIEKGTYKGLYYNYHATTAIGTPLSALSPATQPIGGQGREIVYNNGYVYTCASNSLIAQYSADLNTGLLTPLIPATVATSGLTRSLVFHPTLAYAYSACQTTNNIDIFSVGSNGVLSSLGSFNVGNTTSCLKIHPTLNILYATEFAAASNGLRILSINPSTGALSNLSSDNIGFPIWIDLSVDGTSAYIKTNNQTIQRSIDISTGLFTGGNSYSNVATSSGQFIIISPNQNYVYAISADSNTIDIFSRDLTTGILTYISTTTVSNEALGMTFTTDGTTAYAYSNNGPYIVYFIADLITGALSNIGGTSSNMISAFGAIISPNQKYVYVSSLSGNTTQLTRLSTTYAWAQKPIFEQNKPDINSIKTGVIGQEENIILVESVVATIDSSNDLIINVNDIPSAPLTLPAGVTSNLLLKSTTNKLKSRVSGLDSNEIDLVQSVVASTIGNKLDVAVNGLDSNQVDIINSNVISSTANTIQSVVNGVTSSTATIINTNAISQPTPNNLKTTINGIDSNTLPIVQSVSMSSSANNMTTTVNGVTSSVTPIVNTNVVSYNSSTSQLTTTVNGVASSAVTLPVTPIAERITASSNTSRVVTASQDPFTGGLINYQSGTIITPVSIDALSFNLTQIGTYLITFSVSVTGESGSTQCAGNATNLVMPSGSAATISVANLRPISAVQDTTVFREYVNVSNVSGGAVTVSPTAGASGAIAGSFSSVIYEIEFLNGSTQTPSIVTNLLTKSTINKIQSTVNGVQSANQDLVQSVVCSTVANSLDVNVNGIDSTPVNIVNSNSLIYNSTTNELQSNVNGVVSTAVILNSSGGGGVSNVSVVSANGLAGTVANPTTTPTITLTTTVNGMVKGNATAFSAAVLGTDYAKGTGTTGRVATWSATGTLTTGNVYPIDSIYIRATANTVTSGLGASQSVTGSTYPTSPGPSFGVVSGGNMQASINAVGIYEVEMSASYVQSVAGTNGQGSMTPYGGFTTGNATAIDGGPRLISPPAGAVLAATVGNPAMKFIMTVTAVPCQVGPLIGQVAAGSGLFNNIQYKITRVNP